MSKEFMISEIKCPRLKKLAEQRRKESDWPYSDDLDDLEYAFLWGGSPEGHDFWWDVQLEKITELPKEQEQKIEYTLINGFKPAKQLPYYDFQQEKHGVIAIPQVDKEMEEDVKEKEATTRDTSYHGGKDNPYESIKIIEAHNLNFNKGNAIKYTLRAGHKDPEKEIEDIEKGRDYLEYEIARLKIIKNQTK